MRPLTSDKDCADCICRVCARNTANDSWNPKLAQPGDKGKSCNCDCNIGDEMFETDTECQFYLPDIEDDSVFKPLSVKDIIELWKNEANVPMNCSANELIMYHIENDILCLITSNVPALFGLHGKRYNKFFNMFKEHTNIRYVKLVPVAFGTITEF